MFLWLYISFEITLDNTTHIQISFITLNQFIKLLLLFFLENSRSQGEVIRSTTGDVRLHPTKKKKKKNSNNKFIRFK